MLQVLCAKIITKKEKTQDNDKFSDDKIKGEMDGIRISISLDEIRINGLIKIATMLLE